MTTAPQPKSLMSYLKWAIISTIVGLALGVWLGWETTGTLPGTFTVFFIVAVLAVLEISLYFDNAIVNAQKLRAVPLMYLLAPLLPLVQPRLAQVGRPARSC